MEFNDVLSLVLAIISGVTTCIPLIVQLVKYIKMAAAERNFGNIMKIVVDLMPEAEEKFSTGEARKQYVMSNIESLSNSLHYEVDLDKVSTMIDAIVAASKKINIDKK